jgi:hypothetical protein
MEFCPVYDEERIKLDNRDKFEYPHPIKIIFAIENQLLLSYE